MSHLHHDFETYSRADLLKVGADVYARDPSTRVLMCAYAFDDGPIKQWLPAEGELIPDDLYEAMFDPEVIKIAWNKPFEWSIWTHVLKIETPHSQWEDPMLLAGSLSFPASLADCGEAMKLPVEHLKDRRGKALIKKFCQPRKPTANKPWEIVTFEHEPDEWERFKWYNRQDVHSERLIYSKIKKFPPIPSEKKFYILDQKINQGGIPINTNMVRNAIDLSNKVRKNIELELIDITGLTNPNSQPQFLEWARKRRYVFEDLKRGHVERGINEAEGDLKRALELRLDLARTGVKKYEALLRASSDGWIRNTLRMYGAPRTGRFSGQLFQPQNIPRPTAEFSAPEAQERVAYDIEHMSFHEFVETYPRPMDALTSAIRPSVQAIPGYLLVSVDLKAIENVVLGVISGDERILDVFRSGRDPYIDFAQYMFHGSSYDELWEEYKNGNKEKRTISKPPVLGCGYLLGEGTVKENRTTGELEYTGLLGYAYNMGIELTPEQSKLAVRTWRGRYVDAVKFWESIQNAFMKCIKTKETVTCNMVRFRNDSPFVIMDLPSGRSIYYFRPKIKMMKKPWGELGETIVYQGQNQVTRKWGELSTHPGKITENADQAISRDLLCHFIMKCRRFNVIFHVHDEIIFMVKENEAESVYENVKEIMSTPPWWLHGAPLGAEGRIGKMFVKD